MAKHEIRVPDIGTSAAVDVIEVMVKPGDEIKKDDSMITLESEKASMEVPAPKAGKIAEVKVKVGDKISEGDLILIVEVQEEASATTSAATEQKKPDSESAKAATSASAAKASPTSEDREVKVPDLGGASEVDVIEVMVKPGDKIEKDASIITLESEKASMEIPAPFAGTVKSVKINVGDKVHVGDVILMLTTEGGAPEISQQKEMPPQKVAEPEVSKTTSTQAAPAEKTEKRVSETANGGDIHASPSVRRLSRILGVDLNTIKGTGHKGRIQESDLLSRVKSMMQGGGSAGLVVAPAPSIDFSKFGPIEMEPLSKIKRFTGKNTHRSWVTVPHVTQFDEADITELEKFRNEKKEEAQQKGVKLTMLAFLMKAAVSALKAFPTFNASLDESGENLILKKYYNIGVAVDTPNGLVVPVIRDVDCKGFYDLAAELGTISAKARDKGLSLTDMQGSCFTISSLGGIGGTAFTPIVNAPDVAILGASRAQMKPIYQQNQFVPRLMLPLSLSYDHRVIDGALAARFSNHLVQVLGDIRQILL